MALFQSLSGKSVVLNVGRGDRLGDHQGALCEAFNVLPTFCLTLVDGQGCMFQDWYSLPFAKSCSSYQVLFSWKSLFDEALQGSLLALTDFAEHEGETNSADCALATGGYTSPMMRETWSDGGLTLAETIAYAAKACRFKLFRGSWAVAFRRASRISSRHIGLDDVRTLNTIVDGAPMCLGPLGEGAIRSLRVYMDTHDILLRPRVKRLRRKTKVPPLRRRLARYNARQVGVVL